MRINKKFVAFVFTMVALLAANIASAQNIAPDDRYKGYPTSLVGWPDALPNLATCVSQEYYEPTDTHLLQYTTRVKIAGVRVQETDECRWMRTSNGDRWVLRPEGTKHALDAQGRELFDMGSPAGSACGNPSPFGIPVNVPDIASVPVTPATQTVVSPRVRIGFAPVPRLVLTPAAQPAPTSQPVVEKTTEPEKAPRANHAVVSFGAGYTMGSDNTDYVYPNPNKGDVPKKNRYASPVLFARVDQSADHGVFGTLAVTLCGSSSDMLFQDITGAWVTKIRTTDSSCDKGYSFAGGYKFALGDIVHVGVSGNYDYWDFAQKYNGQNTDTVSERSFKTFGLGVEASGSTKSEDHKVTVSADGLIGVGGNRDNSTTQDYLGPPAKTFPQVTDPSQPAKLNRIGGRVSVQAVGNLHAFADVHRSAWSSTRPDPYHAVENTASFAVTFGGFYTWGNK